MPSDPVIISQGTNEGGPANPVRIANWDDFIDAVATAVAGNTHVDSIHFNTAFPTPAFEQGLLFWDSTDHTLAFHQGSGVGGVTQQIGQEQNAYVWNNSGVDIPNGAACRPTGSLSFRPTVALAQADTLEHSLVHCVATQPIPKNSAGFVTTFGLVRNIDTQTPGWNEGDFLYLSEVTPGALRNTAPSTGFSQIVAICVRKHINFGMIFVCPRAYSYFGGLFAGNYTQFDADGTMVAVGNATCWKDILQSLTGAKITSPSADFEINDAEASVTAKISCRYPTDYVYMNIQLNHDWKKGSSVHPHIHWWQTTANTPNWLIGYRWQRQGQLKTTSWTLSKWQTNELVYPGAGTFNQITEFDTLAPPVGYNQVSDILQIRLYRDYTNVSTKFGGVDPVNASQDVVNLDLHYEVDMLGSHSEYVK